MAITRTKAAVIRAITSSVPSRRFDNMSETTAFETSEVEKVVKMAGVKTRHMAAETECSSDLCVVAAQDVLQALQWDPATVDALIFVTQTPDYFLPSTACLVQRRLGISDACAAFDVGLGCSGYPYGLWLAAMMLQCPGMRRALVLHGETPTRFSDRGDRAVALLFGDAGSATALEAAHDGDSRPPWWFCLHTDGTGAEDLILAGGGFRERFPADPRRSWVYMNGANVFNFTIKRVPSLVDETLNGSGVSRDEIDYVIFHQSNRFIIRHLMKKANIAEAKVPMTIADYGSVGGPSVPLTMTEGQMVRPADRALRLLLLGYGVGLSWGSALLDLPPDARLNHVVLPANGS
jgi:3-oxoacyl-[acyl-carrier-protein] synthase III